MARGNNRRGSSGRYNLRSRSAKTEPKDGPMPSTKIGFSNESDVPAPAPLVGVPGSTVPSSAVDGSSFSSITTNPAPATVLESLLERQWDLGSDFLMDQAETIGIGELLSMLHKYKAENQSMESDIQTLVQKRNQLVAFNAQLRQPIYFDGVGFGVQVTLNDMLNEMGRQNDSVGNLAPSSYLAVEEIDSSRPGVPDETLSNSVAGVADAGEDCSVYEDFRSPPHQMLILNDNLYESDHDDNMEVVVENEIEAKVHEELELFNMCDMIEIKQEVEELD